MSSCPSQRLIELLNSCVALAPQLFYHRLDQLFGTVDLTQYRLKIERRLRWVAVRRAVNPVLPNQDERVGQHIERDGQSPARRAHHEFIFFQLIAAIVKDRHASLPLLRRGIHFNRVVGGRSLPAQHWLARRRRLVEP